MMVVVLCATGWMYLKFVSQAKKCNLFNLIHGSRGEVMVLAGIAMKLLFYVLFFSTAGAY